MVRTYCAGCGDRLRPVRVFKVMNRAPLGFTIRDYGTEYRHTTRRRWDNRYRPDYVTPAQIMRRLKLSGRVRRTVGVN